jgi:hypothetical protein
MLRPHKLPALGILLVFVLGTVPVRAQDAANADKLFNRGVADMAEGYYDRACPALAESQRLEPTPGTLFTLAECEAKAGKLATALAHYTEYLQQFEGLKPLQRLNHHERAGIARSKQKALQQEVPTLALVLPGGAPAGVRVTRDGAEVGAALIGIALPVDPGEHVITTQAPGGPLVTERVTLSLGEAKSVALKVVATAPATADKPPAPGPMPPSAPDAGRGRRIAGFVVGATGIAGLTVGVIAGGFALSKASIRDDNCQEDAKACNWEGYAAHVDGRTAANVSTAGFAIGLAGLVAGAVLVLTAPAGKKPPGAQAALRAGLLRAGPAGAVAGMEGAF